MNTKKNSSNRSFGVLFFIIFFIMGFYPFLNSGNLKIFPIIISLIFLFLGLINSNILTPLNRAWIKFGIILGKIFSPIIILIIFFFVVTPTGFVMRILGYDLLRLKYTNEKSYWQNKSNIKTNMKNQF